MAELHIAITFGVVSASAFLVQFIELFSTQNGCLLRVYYSLPHRSFPLFPITGSNADNFRNLSNALPRALGGNLKCVRTGAATEQETAFNEYGQ